MTQPAKAKTIVADPVEDKSQPPQPEQIAALAYALWQAKGCPEGSAEGDWLQAERELRTPGQL